MLICKMPPRRTAIQEPSCLGGTELLPETTPAAAVRCETPNLGQNQQFFTNYKRGKKKKVMSEGSVAAKRVAVG